MSDLQSLMSASILPEPDEPEDTGTREFLAFVVGREHYALPLSSVREIVRVPTITEVPRGPRDVLGIFSVRGQVTTLIDMRKTLSMETAELSRRTRILLVDHGRETLGLLVDKVLQVYRLREDEVEMASVLGNEASAHVMGIGRPGGGRGQKGAVAERAEHNELLILLDPMALLRQYGSA